MKEHLEQLRGTVVTLSSLPGRARAVAAAALKGFNPGQAVVFTCELEPYAQFPGEFNNIALWDLPRWARELKTTYYLEGGIEKVLSFCYDTYSPTGCVDMMVVDTHSKHPRSFWLHLAGELNVLLLVVEQEPLTPMEETKP